MSFAGCNSTNRQAGRHFGDQNDWQWHNKKKKSNNVWT